MKKKHLFFIVCFLLSAKLLFSQIPAGYDYNAVYETTNGGSTWTDIFSGLSPVPAGAIVINEQNTTEHELYAGTDFGVFANISNRQRYTLGDTSIIKEQFSIAENHRNNPDSALIYYNKALEIAKNINAVKYTALSYKYIGTSYYYKSDFEKALEYWQKSLQKYKSINDKKGTAAVLGNLGIIYQYQSDYQKTIETYQEALSISKEINDKSGIASNLNNLGTMYEHKGHYIKALEYYQKAIKINEKIGNQNGLASNYTNIGIVYKIQNEFDKALEYYNKAIEINQENKNIRKLSRIYINVGIVYCAKKNYSIALDYYKKALEINKKIGDRNIVASNLENIGIIHDYQKNYDLALDYYKKALKINQEIGNKRSIATNLVNISSIYYNKKEYNKTILNANKALSIAKEIGDLYLKRSIYQNLSESYENINNYPKAISYKNTWIELNDSLYNIEKSKAITDIQTRYETEKKDQEIESLHKDNEIKNLQIEEDKQRSKAQRRLLAAFIFSFFSIAILIWFLFKNYKKQQIIKQQKLEFQKVLTEQKMLRSQMNPHFIYNSLNSIQSYISSEKSYEAEKYLARFAKLMRSILENSRLDYVTLDKEIETLELYLSLEQLRFENRFTYHINTDSLEESDFISIPPMLIQPFIENAILHGFKNKTEGKLDLKFIEKDEYIICEINDNGIGRKASDVQQLNKKHKSLATTITEDRLQTLSKELNKPAFFKIEDKIDKVSQEALGTKVTIQIPYSEN